ncbi:peptidoglycan bridge formation glycyltransferase FemA/FemB family protein [uncultured Sphaerochaeta sp.]|uniref:lipid II:glycine glycyltransferase FemX n=1 Tax=uncultured Sphaerochaeta sp. TaxID=886478 RepID=UPI0029CA6254|nr:peptidoglycan bridge formation glycyltransferase FemA/FemB family protein [uncultured Sphaerochaeta sp.]
MTMRIQRIATRELSPSGAVFQSSYWAEVKQRSGWKSYSFSVEMEGSIFTLLVLVKRMAPFCSLAYIPFGPPLSSLKLSQVGVFLEDLAKQMRRLLPKGVFALRYDLPFEEVNDQNVMTFLTKRLRTLEQSVQPEGTVRIDLKWGYHAVTLGYRERAKRALRKADQVFQVRVHEGDETSFLEWYEVYLETARRDGFSPRSKKYLRSLMMLSPDERMFTSQLLLAYEGKKIVGGIIVLFSPSEALFLYGASLRFDGISCSYILQDFAIRMACERKCEVYDLYGIPGPKGRASHLAGLEIFKRSFGGQPYYRSPSTDYLYNRLTWHCYMFFETIRFRSRRSIKSQAEALPSS